MTGFIYAIRAGEHVKIGWSMNPWRRFTKIQSDNHIECELLGIVDASREEEAALHCRFADSRSRGEWFAMTDPVREYVSAMPIPKQNSRKRRDPQSRLDSYLLRNSLTASQFALQLGIAPSTISRIARGKRRPSFRTLRKIMIETNGAVTPNDFLENPERHAPSQSENAA